MPDAIFAHPRLAAVYDTFDGHRDDLNSYLALAEELWAADTAPVTMDVPRSGMVEQRREVTQVSLPFVSFRYTYRFDDGAVITSDSMLRFRSREEAESSLAAHGYRVVEVRDAPDRPGREFVFIARRT